MKGNLWLCLLHLLLLHPGNQVWQRAIQVANDKANATTGGARHSSDWPGADYGNRWPLVSDSRLSWSRLAPHTDKDTGEEQGTEDTHVYALVPSACTGSLREKMSVPVHASEPKWAVWTGPPWSLGNDVINANLMLLSAACFQFCCYTLTLYTYHLWTEQDSTLSHCF